MVMITPAGENFYKHGSLADRGAEFFTGKAEFAEKIILESCESGNNTNRSKLYS
jgi:hypothetical protein